MDCKLFGFFILFTIFAVISSEDSCPVILSVKGSIFNFTKQISRFINSCLKLVVQKIIRIDIDFCTLEKDFDMFRDIQLVDLERLTITNSDLKSIDFSELKVPNLIYLDLSGNVLKKITVISMMNLKFINLSSNLLMTLTIDHRLSLDFVDLSGNSISEGVLRFSNLKKLNMSNSLITNKEFKNIDISIKIDMTSIDLSNNNLSDIGFLHLEGENGTLILDNNYLTNLVQLKKITENISGLSIFLANNPFQCTLSLFCDWILMKSKSFDLGNDLICSFANLNNLYSVNKYGYLFSNETNVLEEMWSGQQLVAYLSFQNITFTRNVSAAGITVKWNSEKQTVSVVYVLLKSQQGGILYSRRVFTELNQKTMQIEFNRINTVSVACFVVEIPRHTLNGLENRNITLLCQHLNIGSSTEYKKAFIAILVIGLTYILLTLIMFSIYHFKKRKPPIPLSNNPSGNFEMAGTSRNDETAFANDTNFRPPDISTPDIRLAKSRMTSKTLPLPRNADSYTNMGMSDESRSSTVDNIYEEFG